VPNFEKSAEAIPLEPVFFREKAHPLVDFCNDNNDCSLPCVSVLRGQSLFNPFVGICIFFSRLRVKSLQLSPSKLSQRLYVVPSIHDAVIVPFAEKNQYVAIDSLMGCTAWFLTGLFPHPNRVPLE
jgi:hypothetical protein